MKKVEARKRLTCKLRTLREGINILKVTKYQALHQKKEYKSVYEPYLKCHI